MVVIGAEALICLTNLQNLVRIPAKFLTRAAKMVAREQRLRGDISIVFVDNRTIRRLNRRHLGHDRITDVISFPLGDEVNPYDKMAGEIIVSAQKAQQEAKRRNLPVRRELLLYVVHGLLHLCGYDDDTPERRRKMRLRENSFLDAFLS